MWAHGDGVIPEQSVRSLCETLGGATTITVAGGHNWLLADPQRFGEVVMQITTAAERAHWFRARSPGVTSAGNTTTTHARERAV